MKIKNVFILFSLILTLACSESKTSDDKQGINLSGKINFPESQGLVTIEAFNQGKFLPIDTVLVNEDNSFKSTIEVTAPNLYRLNFYSKQLVFLILRPEDDQVSVSVDGNAPNGHYEVKGSVDTDFFYEVQKIKEETMEFAKQLNAEFASASQLGNMEKVEELQWKYMQKEKEVNEKIKIKIGEMGNSITAIIATQFLDENNDFPFLAQIADKFKRELPDSEFTKQLNERVASLKKLAIGEVAPEIVMQNPEGEEVKLSSLRGKYVMIDFWAAWCKPCRQENPNVVKLYNKYSDKGFEVLGVSLDRKKEDWVKAIEQDGLTWIHISDLKYFQSEAAQEYKINAIPATFLIDKEGKIIAKNLRGISLKKKLEEIFGEV